MSSLIKLFSLLTLLILVISTSPEIRENEKDEIIIKSVTYKDSSCLNDVYFQSMMFFQIILNFDYVPIATSTKAPLTDTSIYYNISIYDEKDTFIAESNDCFIYSKKILCLFIKEVNFSIGKYYIIAEPNEETEHIFKGYNGRDYPFEITDKDVNFIYIESFSYSLSTFHGNKNKKLFDDYLYIQFYKNISKAKNIPDIIIKGDGDDKKLPCKFSEYDNSIIKCEIKYNEFTPNKQLYLFSPTSCNGISDVIPYQYESEDYIFINIKNYYVDKQCIGGKTKYISGIFEVEVLEGELTSLEYDLYSCFKIFSGKDNDFHKYSQADSFNYLLFTNKNFIIFYKILTDHSENNYFFINWKDCIATTSNGQKEKNIVIKPFFFKDAFVKNDNSLEYTDGQFYVDYDTSGNGEFNITFSDDLTTENVPKITLNSIELDCNYNLKILTCQINSLQAPAGSNDYIAYKAEVSNICGENYKNYIYISVRNTNTEEIPKINLENAQFEKKCYVYSGETQKKIKFTLNYIEETTNSTNYNLKDFSLNLVNLEVETEFAPLTPLISSTCSLNNDENIFVCEFPESTIKSFASGYYSPNLTEGLHFGDYIINPFSTNESIYLSNEKAPTPINTIKDKLVINAKFSDIDESYSAIINFSEDLSADNIPRILINDKEINCTKFDRASISCILLKEEFPYGDKLTVYTGKMLDVCNNEIIQIILNSKKAEDESDDSEDPHIGLIIGISVVGIIIVIGLNILFIRRKVNRKKFADTTEIENLNLNL